MFSFCYSILTSKKAQVDIYLKIDLNLNAFIQRIEINKFWTKICWDFKNGKKCSQTESVVVFFSFVLTLEKNARTVKI